MNHLCDSIFRLQKKKYVLTNISHLPVKSMPFCLIENGIILKVVSDGLSIAGCQLLVFQRIEEEKKKRSFFFSEQTNLF